jgi:hypothetical protein
MLLNVPDPVPYVCILNDATVNKDKRKMKKETLGEIQVRQYC